MRAAAGRLAKPAEKDEARVAGKADEKAAEKDAGIVDASGIETGIAIVIVIGSRLHQALPLRLRRQQRKASLLLKARPPWPKPVRQRLGRTVHGRWRAEIVVDADVGAVVAAAVGFQNRNTPCQVRTSQP